MDKYLALEKQLAELLGWKLKLVGDVPTGWLDPAGNYHPVIPNWCRYWSACGPLMVEHDIEIQYASNSNDMYATHDVKAVRNIGAMGGIYLAFHAKYADHPDKDTAVRFAVVQAVIDKLTATRDTGKDE